MNPAVRATVPALNVLSQDIDKIEYKQLNTIVTNMSFFDRFEDADICMGNGAIRAEMPELLEGIQIEDRLRYCLLLEESEFYEAFDETDRKEFLFHIFKRIALGGGVCQYEDNVQEYIDSAKNMYKDLVTVTKDAESGELKIGSYVFEVSAAGDEQFWGDDHPQHFFYVMVDPFHWHVTIWFNKFVNFW